MKNLLLAFVILFSSQLNAQFEWQYEYPDYSPDSTSSNYSMCNDLIQTAGDGYLMAGETDWPTGAIRHYVRLVKTDSDGNLEWERTYGEGEVLYEQAAAVIQTAEGNYITAGFANNQALLQQVDATGNPMWRATQNVFDASNYSTLRAQADGTIIAAGRASEGALLDEYTGEGTLINTHLLPVDSIFEIKDLQILNDGYVICGHSNNAGVLLRLNANFDIIWREYGGTNSHYFQKVIVDTDGDFVVSGSLVGDAFVAATITKINSDGQLIWSTIANHPSSGYAIAEEEANAYIVAGGPMIYVATDGTIAPITPMDDIFTALVAFSNSCATVAGNSPNNHFTLASACATTDAVQTPIAQVVLAIYPNPFTNYLHIEWDNDTDFSAGTFYLFDAKGAQLFQKKISQKSTTIDLTNFPAGLYSYTYMTENGQILTGKCTKSP